MIFRALILAMALAVVTPVSISAARAGDTAFATLRDNIWQDVIDTNPGLATRLGDRRGDGKLADLSRAAQQKQIAKARRFLARLNAIDPENLPATDQIDYQILKRSLASTIEADGFGQSRYVLFTNRGGWHTWFARLAGSSPFFTRADFDSYVARLEAYGAHNAAGIAMTRRAIAGGFTQPCAPMQGFEKTIRARIVNDPDKSPFFAPFARRPKTISATDWKALKARARAAITDVVNPAHQAFEDFYLAEYAPRCRKSIGISDTPDGAEFYNYRIREMTTTEMSADEIHALGLREVARIRAEMDAVVKASGFKGDRKAFIAKLRSDPQYYPKTGAELIAKTSALAKKIDGWMPKLFGKLPRLPYTVKPIPAEQAPGNTTAYYEPGALAIGRPGIYRVNLTELDQRPLFELPALGVHEAVPGHHHQIALQQELPLHDFRKNGAYFTAFVEGWGLYSERLGIEMGLYDTPAKDIGRLSYEMWRACRLVVDTGIHAKGWSKQRAVDFMLDNTALSPANVDAEVNRYITWPAQALAYKIGELKIRALRARAENALGKDFDLRKFHDTVLENGAIPLDVLETYVDGWIARERAAANKN